MNLRLFLLSVFLPNKLKKKNLLELFNVTAEAFQMSVPLVSEWHFDDILRAYASFTREAVSQQINKDEDVSRVRHRLYDGAVRLGVELRQELRIHSFKDAMKAASLLYRAIGIGFRCDRSGEVAISRCYFSSFYTREVCWLISSLDEGLIAGLTDGGKLWFLSRITEGNISCVGQIEFGK